MAGALLGRFLLLTQLCTYARATKFCRESHGMTHNNEVLIGHSYKSLLTRGIFGCGHECLASLKCTSYNYQTSAVGRGICELNDGEFSGKRHLVKKQGFFFRSSEMETETQKLLGGLETRGKNIGILLHSGEDGVSLLRNVLRLQFRTRLGLDSSHVTELEQ